MDEQARDGTAFFWTSQGDITSGFSPSLNSLAGRKEDKLSRLPNRYFTQPNDQNEPANVCETTELASRARDLFGPEAPSVVAFCALDAWLAEDRASFNSMAAVFKRLQN
ncbi:hypothetical protein FE840_019080 (plasmid) [Peteryoungia desertarenae]|uniref:Uncharacterized protein n=1 Tax=Peteryoungia desertarenae TaxID=1813451 RepID=A0ABX6QT63_9HYPH|nr:hypothetical protein [Peteryoungia desertarenae]QLF71733.1 hypothetical protein FE840_019080 [Peteryoungia desertarenae]